MKNPHATSANPAFTPLPGPPDDPSSCFGICKPLHLDNRLIPRIRWPAYFVQGQAVNERGSDQPHCTNQTHPNSVTWRAVDAITGQAPKKYRQGYMWNLGNRAVGASILDVIGVLSRIWETRVVWGRVWGMGTGNRTSSIGPGWVQGIARGQEAGWLMVAKPFTGGSWIRLHHRYSPPKCVFLFEVGRFKCLCSGWRAEWSYDFESLRSMLILLSHALIMGSPRGRFDQVPHLSASSAYCGHFRTIMKLIIYCGEQYFGT